MSEYRVEESYPSPSPRWHVIGAAAWCHARTDAERIARALALLDAAEMNTTTCALPWPEVLASIHRAFPKREPQPCPECAAGNTPHTIAHEGKP